MSREKRKYIESHWLVFIIKGVAAIGLGAVALLATFDDYRNLLIIVAVAMLMLGMVELFNVFHQKKTQNAWGLALTFAIISIAVSIALFFTLNHENIVASTVVLAIFTLFRGLSEILIGLHSIPDKSDKFMWVATGIIGIVLAFMIFNFPAADNATFIRIFGGYMMVFGLTDVMFGTHARSMLKAKKKK